MGVKMNLLIGIMTKNKAADPKMGFFTKFISKPYGAMPTVLELSMIDKTFY